MFERCDFLLGENDSVVIVVRSHLPDAETYTVSVCDENIRFKAGYEKIAEISYQGGEVFRRIANHTQVGMVVYEEGETLPSHLTHVAYVEVRRAH